MPISKIIGDPFTTLRSWVWERRKVIIPNPLKPSKTQIATEKEIDNNKLQKTLDGFLKKINIIIDEVNTLIQKVAKNEADISVIQTRLDVIDNMLKLKSTATHIHGTGAGPSGPPIGRKGGSVRKMQKGGRTEITLTYDLHIGTNLISIPLDLVGVNSSIESVFGAGSNYTHIIGEGTSATYDNTGNWAGSLTNIDPLSGYWVGVNIAQTLEITGYLMVNPIYNLHAGSNLISFPGMEPVSILNAFPDDVAPLIDKIVGEGESAIFWDELGGWTGSLIEFKPQKGYWVSVSEDSSFRFNLPPTT